MLQSEEEKNPLKRVSE